MKTKFLSIIALFVLSFSAMAAGNYYGNNWNNNGNGNFAGDGNFGFNMNANARGNGYSNNGYTNQPYYDAAPALTNDQIAEQQKAQAQYQKQMEAQRKAYFEAQQKAYNEYVAMMEKRFGKK